MAKLIYCIVRDYPQASNIVGELRASGFAKDDISVLMPDTKAMRELAHERAGKPAETRATEGAATGAGAGGILGGAMGWLAGIGTLAIPGVGPLIVAGPLMAALSGIAVGAAFGGVTGALVGLGMSEAEAKRYAGHMKSGSVLISVHSDDDGDIARAREIFERAGAGDISTADESSPRGESRSRDEATRRGASSAAGEALGPGESSAPGQSSTARKERGVTPATERRASAAASERKIS